MNSHCCLYLKYIQPHVLFNIQMNEESGTDLQIEHDELTIEGNLKTESEDLNEEIAPNETPPEEKATFNDNLKFTQPEVKKTL